MYHHIIDINIFFTIVDNCIYFICIYFLKNISNDIIGILSFFKMVYKTVLVSY